MATFPMHEEVHVLVNYLHVANVVGKNKDNMKLVSQS
jgi:hypothetical protein